MLWWAMHRLAFQLAALWHCGRDDARKTRSHAGSDNAKVQRFAIFYTTCDDFVPECLESCLLQEYPKESFTVVVCDDSRDPDCQAEIARVCDGKDGVELLRRGSRRGFKAGNLNHAFAVLGHREVDWIIIVDADQKLPKDFLGEIAKDTISAPEDVAFIQAGQQVREETPPMRATRFQAVMRPNVLMLFERDLPWRGVGGFYPFLGHGGAIRAAAWRQLGGFPECVSEDMAFTMAVHQRGWRGTPALHARSWDASPQDFAAFVVQLSKYAAGAAELLVRHYPRYLCGPANLIEKADAGIWLASYSLFPILLANLPLSAWLSHRIWHDGLVLLESNLAVGFIGMFLLSFPPLISVTPSMWKAIRHWFWSFAVYNAALPAAAWSFLLHLWKRPDFNRTPKGDWSSPRLRLTGLITALSGIVYLTLAARWSSPFSLLVGAAGMSQALFPILRFLHIERGIRGTVSRLIVWIPGLMFLAGVVAMWLLGS